LAPSWNIDRLFEDFFANSTLGEMGTSVFPAWNVSEDERSIRVEAELPGFSRDALDIHFAGRELRISGARHASTEDETTTYHRRERFTGNFSRTLRLGVPIDADKVEAIYKDGILTVTLPKSEAALPRKIRVNAAPGEAHRNEGERDHEG
jgi:HSP20 family protein